MRTDGKGKCNADKKKVSHLNILILGIAYMPWLGGCYLGVLQLPDTSSWRSTSIYKRDKWYYTQPATGRKRVQWYCQQKEGRPAVSCVCTRRKGHVGLTSGSQGWISSAVCDIDSFDITWQAARRHILLLFITFGSQNAIQSTNKVYNIQDGLYWRSTNT